MGTWSMDSRRREYVACDACESKRHRFVLWVTSRTVGGDVFGRKGGDEVTFDEQRRPLTLLDIVIAGLSWATSGQSNHICRCRQIDLGTALIVKAGHSRAPLTRHSITSDRKASVHFGMRSRTRSPASAEESLAHDGLERWSHFIRQPVKVDSPIQRTNHHEDAETVFG